MKNVLAFIISVFVLALWSVPLIAIKVHVTAVPEKADVSGSWAVLYAGVLLVTILWGAIIYNWYED